MSNYTLKTKPSLQYFTKQYRSNALGSATRVNCSVFDKNGRLFIGTDKGVMYTDSDRFVKLSGVYTDVNSVCLSHSGEIIFSSGCDIYRIENDRICLIQSLPDPVLSISSNASVSFALTSKALYKSEVSVFENVQDVGFEPTGALCVTPDGEAYVACRESFLRLFGKRVRFGNMLPTLTNTPDAVFSSISADKGGMLWCGSDRGLYIFDGKSEWIYPSELSAFPKCRINVIEFGRENVYIGTGCGLYIVNGETTRFYGSGRYLTGNSVTSVSFDENESVIWVGTENGLSRIERKLMTLSEKARYFEEMLPLFYREGYYTKRVGVINGDLTTGHPQITDNDGLYTADHTAFMSVKYAVTGDEQCRKNARESMTALLKLQCITGIKGFPARAYRRPGEHGFGDGDPEWHLSSDEKGELEWKGETSSDELVGHYFASCWYYDLCADESEKEQITASIKNITEHILTNGYTLCDVDGKPTTWAHFGPEELNHDNGWCWEKGVNSLELLSFLLITYHMTGDQKYLDIKNELAYKYHYAMNILTYKKDDAHSNCIDDRLTLYIATHMLRLETDETLLRYVKMAIRRHYEYIKDDHHPYFTFIFMLSGGGCHALLDDAVRVLEEYPVDRRYYKTDNSIRPDFSYEERVRLFGERDHSKYPFPASERVTGELHSTARSIRCDDDTSFCVPCPWLLSYWTGVYFGYIE